MLFYGAILLFLRKSAVKFSWRFPPIIFIFITSFECDYKIWAKYYISLVRVRCFVGRHILSYFWSIQRFFFSYFSGRFCFRILHRIFMKGDSNHILLMIRETWVICYLYKKRAYNAMTCCMRIRFIRAVEYNTNTDLPLNFFSFWFYSFQISDRNRSFQKSCLPLKSTQSI